MRHKLTTVYTELLHSVLAKEEDIKREYINRGYSQNMIHNSITFTYTCYLYPNRKADMADITIISSITDKVSKGLDELITTYSSKYTKDITNRILKRVLKKRCKNEIR